MWALLGLLLLILAGLVILAGIAFLAIFAVAMLFGYGVYLILSKPKVDPTLLWLRKTGGVLCIALSCLIAYRAFNPSGQTHKPTTEAVSPISHNHVEGVAPGKFLIPRSFSFSADGSVHLYAGTEGYKEELSVMTYDPSLGVLHINVTPGFMTAYEAVYPISTNKEVHFRVDYDPR